MSAFALTVASTATSVRIESPAAAVCVSVRIVRRDRRKGGLTGCLGDGSKGHAQIRISEGIRETHPTDSVLFGNSRRCAARPSSFALLFSFFHRLLHSSVQALKTLATCSLEIVPKCLLFVREIVQSVCYLFVKLNSRRGTRVWVIFPWKRL